MLRISLIVAVLAGLAGLYVAHVPVATKIKTISTERDDALAAQQAAESAEAKAKGEARQAKEDLDKANEELAARTEALDATVSRLSEQQRRADQLFEQLTSTTRERNDAQAELNAYQASGLTPDQIRNQREIVNNLTAERDTFIAENKILLRQVNYLESELSRFIGDREMEVKLPDGLKGRIVAVDPKYDFVVLDIGGNQGVLENGKMLVNRDGKLIGKVKITKVEPNRSIANIIPDWKYGDVSEGDQVLY